MSNDCFSEWGSVPAAGVPQGTKLGPWLFIIMINDLTVSGVDALWKYVDDTTLSESLAKNDPSLLQHYVDDFVTKSQSDGLQLKESKCKEFRVDFSKPCRSLQPILINNKSIDVVPSVKLLGLTISEDLKWNQHVMDICKNVWSRLYFLRQLKRAKVPSKELVLFYTTCTVFARLLNTRVRCFIIPCLNIYHKKLRNFRNERFGLFSPSYIIKKF